MADAQLGASRCCETGEQDGPFIGPTIAIRIPKKQNLGRAGNDQPAAPRQEVVRADSEPAGLVQGDLQMANFADAQFDSAVADLEAVLQNGRGRLDPLTVLVIERNLKTIDDAIREARTALDDDPANTYLNSHLADSRRRKLHLLRRASVLASAGGN